MKLVTVEQMRAIEQEADANGLTYAQMMENAGRGVAKAIMDMMYLQQGETPEALALVGPGNNGGDALVALAHLAANGWRTRAYLIKRKATKDPLVARVKEAEGEIILAEKDAGYESLNAFIGTASVVIDGILGTGFKLPLKKDVAETLTAVNTTLAALEWPPYVVAVDCPSGVDCDSGEAAPEALAASQTVSMAAVKQGLLKFPAYDLAGELTVADIGLTDEIKSWKALTHQVADNDLVDSFLPARPDDAHKGTFGTALIAAGSINYPGAALLAGKAAYRVGAGLVQMAVSAPVQAVLAGQFPEATWVLMPHAMGSITEGAADVLLKNSDRATALLIGPGFGLEDNAKTFIENLLTGKTSGKKATARIGFVHAASDEAKDKNEKLPPLVFDADGLKLLAKIEDWAKLLPAPAILTPHPGEMSALTGLDKEAIQADRLNVALKYSAQWGHVVVLKGAFTVIAAPDGRTTVIPVATAALARAGTGDVLAGLIVGLRAQGVDAYEAAVAGAYIHAMAGLYAEDRVGNSASVLASDVLDSVADVLIGLV
jgi:NAD(P)H-hydrate epimerase